MGSLDGSYWIKRMHKKRWLMGLVLASLCGMGCQHRQPEEKTATLVGIVAGGVIGAQFGYHGSQVAAATLGALLGGAVGNAIGRTADEGDVIAADRAFLKASRSKVGEVVYWHNKHTRHYGSFKAMSDLHSRNGNYCREFASEFYQHGQVFVASGITCRNPNGTWYLID